MPEAFLPSAEGAEAVLHAARRRRMAKASGAATSTAAVVIGSLLVVGSGTGAAPQPDRLTSTTSPTPVASTSAIPSPPSTRGVGTGRPAPQASPVDTVLGTPSPGAATPPPSQHRSSARRVSPITRSTGTIARTDLCNGGVGDLAGSYCFRALDPGTIRRGTSVRLGGEYCVTSPGRAQTLHLASTREADITVLDGDTTLWQGGEGLTYRTPGPTLTVQPGQCLQWTSVWDTRDREGFVVAPGTYTLDVGISGDTSVATGISLTVVD